MSNKQEKPTTLEGLLRQDDPTERTLMIGLKLAYRSIRDRQRRPEKCTIEELFRVANLINQPVEEVITVVLNEVRESGRLDDLGVPKAVQPERQEEEDELE